MEDLASISIMGVGQIKMMTTYYMGNCFDFPMLVGSSIFAALFSNCHSCQGSLVAPYYALIVLVSYLPFRYHISPRSTYPGFPGHTYVRLLIEYRILSRIVACRNPGNIR